MTDGIEPTEGFEVTQPDSSNGGLRVGRRGLIRGLALGSAVVGAGAVGGVTARTTGGSGLRKKRLTIEVACLGELWREGAKGNPANDGDFRAPFVIEGWIYPEGTIKGDGFIPVEAGSIGRWFCRGYVVIDTVRQEPHAATHQDYFFGKITPGNVFPRSMISSVGLEGTADRTQTAYRAVVGGTGDFLGAIGEVGQRLIATNTSLFADGTDDPAPCWRNEFNLRVFA